MVRATLLWPTSPPSRAPTLAPIVSSSSRASIHAPNCDPPYLAIVSPRSGSRRSQVDDELATPLEQINEAGLAIRTFEEVLLMDLHHRQPAALWGKRVSLPGEFLFFGQKLLASSKPFFSGHYLRKIHCSLSLR